MRLIYLLTAMTAMASCLTGCGGGKGPEKSTTSATSGSATGSPAAASAERAGWEQHLDRLPGRIVPEGEEKMVRWLGWSEQGKTLVFVTPKQLQSFSMPDEKPLASAKCELPSLEDFASSPASDFIVWANKLEDRLEILDAKTLQPRKTLPIEDSTDRAVACSPDGKLLALGQKDGSIALYDTQEWQSAGKLTGHKSTVMHLAFSAGGLLASVAQEEKEIRVWDISKKSVIHTLPAKQSGYYLSQTFLSEKRLASFDDSDLFIWDLETEKIEHTLDVPPLESPVIASPDGKWLAMIDHYGYMSLLSSETGNPQCRVQAQTGHTAGGSSPCPVAFSPDGKQIAIGGPDVRLYDVAKLLTEPKAYHLAGDEKVSLDHGTTVYGLAFAPKLPVLISGDYDGNVKLWSLPDFKETHSHKPHQDLKSLAISPDGKRAAILYGGSYLSLCDLEKGTIEKEFTELGLNAFSRASVAFVDDQQVVYTRDKDAAVYDLSMSKIVRQFAGADRKMEYLALSPDRELLVTAALHQKLATVWNFKDGKELQNIDLIGDALSVAFSPNGRWLALSCRASVGLKVLDAKSLKSAWETTYDAGSGESTVAAFSPDNTLLAEGRGPVLILRDADTGKELRRYFGHSANLQTIAFSPDSKLMATGSQDGTLKIWDVQRKP